MRNDICLPLKVYYDASCPMCASEMHALRKAGGSGTLQLVDCSAAEFDDALFRREGVTRSAMMSRLHVRDAHGRWRIALDAYQAVYHAAGFTKTAKVWGSSWLRPVLGPAYGWIARHRQVISRLGVHRLIRWIVAK